MTQPVSEIPWPAACCIEQRFGAPTHPKACLVTLAPAAPRGTATTQPGLR